MTRFHEPLQNTFLNIILKWNKCSKRLIVSYVTWLCSKKWGTIISIPAGLGHLWLSAALSWFNFLLGSSTHHQLRTSQVSQPLSNTASLKKMSCHYNTKIKLLLKCNRKASMVSLSSVTSTLPVSNYAYQHKMSSMGQGCQKKHLFSYLSPAELYPQYNFSPWILITAPQS
jgi:hypothetical protein